MTSLPLSSLLANASSTGAVKISIPPSNWLVDKDLVIPIRASVLVQPGAHLQIDKGVSLRIEGQITAPNQQIFTGEGTITFGNLSERVETPGGT